MRGFLNAGGECFRPLSTTDDSRDSDDACVRAEAADGATSS